MDYMEEFGDYMKEVVDYMEQVVLHINQSRSLMAGQIDLTTLGHSSHNSWTAVTISTYKPVCR